MRKGALGRFLAFCGERRLTAGRVPLEWPGGFEEVLRYDGGDLGYLDRASAKRAIDLGLLTTSVGDTLVGHWTCAVVLTQRGEVASRLMGAGVGFVMVSDIISPECGVRT
jgi:hypothetical protein